MHNSSKCVTLAKDVPLGVSSKMVTPTQEPPILKILHYSEALCNSGLEHLDFCCEMITQKCSM